jgi:hypothetical protein
MKGKGAVKAYIYSFTNSATLVIDDPKAMLNRLFPKQY